MLHTIVSSCVRGEVFRINEWCRAIVNLSVQHNRTRQLVAAKMTIQEGNSLFSVDISIMLSLSLN